MSKRTIYTIVTPLPKTITRETAVRALHNHSEVRADKIECMRAIETKRDNR